MLYTFVISTVVLFTSVYFSQGANQQASSEGGGEGVLSALSRPAGIWILWLLVWAARAAEDSRKKKDNDLNVFPWQMVPHRIWAGDTGRPKTRSLGLSGERVDDDEDEWASGQSVYNKITFMESKMKWEGVILCLVSPDMDSNHWRLTKTNSNTQIFLSSCVNNWVCVCVCSRIYCFSSSVYCCWSYSHIIKI